MHIPDYAAPGRPRTPSCEPGTYPAHAGTCCLYQSFGSTAACTAAGRARIWRLGWPGACALKAVCNALRRCAYQTEQGGGNLPARLSLMAFPERTELRQKNLFSVAGARDRVRALSQRVWHSRTVTCTHSLHHEYCSKRAANAAVWPLFGCSIEAHDTLHQLAFCSAASTLQLHTS